MPETPAVVPAWKQVADGLATAPDPRLEEDWAAIGYLLVWMEGHEHHGGWSYDPVTRVLSCTCGPLFEYEAVQAA